MFEGVPQYRDEIDCFDPQSRDKEIIKGTVIAAILNKEKRGENVVAKNRYAIVLIGDNRLALCYSLPPVKRGNCPDQWVCLAEYRQETCALLPDLAVDVFWQNCEKIAQKIIEPRFARERIRKLISEKKKKAA